MFERLKIKLRIRQIIRKGYRDKQIRSSLCRQAEYAKSINELSKIFQLLRNYINDPLVTRGTFSLVGKVLCRRMKEIAEESGAGNRSPRKE